MKSVFRKMGLARWKQRKAELIAKHGSLQEFMRGMHEAKKASVCPECGSYPVRHVLDGDVVRQPKKDRVCNVPQDHPLFKILKKRRDFSESKKPWIREQAKEHLERIKKYQKKPTSKNGECPDCQCSFDSHFRGPKGIAQCRGCNNRVCGWKK